MKFPTDANPGAVVFLTGKVVTWDMAANPPLMCLRGLGLEDARRVRGAGWRMELVLSEWFEVTNAEGAATQDTHALVIDTFVGREMEAFWTPGDPVALRLPEATEKDLELLESKGLQVRG